MKSTKALVLVIEDEPSIADTLAYALRTSGYDVKLSTTISSAITCLETNKVSFVILDLGLPDQDGLQFLRKFRENNEIPVLVLTARGEEVDRIVGLELGADDYVVKPFSPREVVARVGVILKRGNRAESATMFRKDSRFAVDEQRMQICYLDNVLELSRYEYRLLLAMLKRPGWVFTREKLMELCWESPEVSLERTVDTHVKTLRAKLREIDPEKEVIRTHRGAGYSLKPEE